MTKCKHCCYNNHLKSSVYNPSGQRYELQLTAYNAMTNHLRKVLLAKSVVDCGKVDNVSNKNVKCRRTGTSARGVKGSLSQNVIDRLAYDTKHHPHIAASMNWGYNYKHRSKYYTEKKSKRSDSAESSEGSGVQEYRFSTTKSYKGELCAGSSARKVNTRSPQPRQRELQGSEPAPGARSRDNRDFEEAEPKSGAIKDQEKVLGRPEEVINLKMFSTVLPCVASTSEISCSGTPEFFASTSNINCDRLFANSQSNISANNESSMYVKFVYDMTKEIMDKGYYSDRDIERVFEKHFRRNLRILNKEKMLEEINCLKKALSMNYDSDNDEDDLAVADCKEFPLGSSSSYSKDRKNVLPASFGEKRKTVEKQTAKRETVLDHDSWESQAGSQIPITIKKDEKTSVCNTELQDNFTEIIVSQEEVLKTLLEMNLNPEKAEEIVESLKNRSKKLQGVLGQENSNWNVRTGRRDNIPSSIKDSNIKSNPSFHYDSMVSTDPKPSAALQKELLGKERFSEIRALSSDEKFDEYCDRYTEKDRDLDVAKGKDDPETMEPSLQRNKLDVGSSDGRDEKVEIESAAIECVAMGTDDSVKNTIMDDKVVAIRKSEKNSIELKSVLSEPSEENKRTPDSEYDEKNIISSTSESGTDSSKESQKGESSSSLKVKLLKSKANDVTNDAVNETSSLETNNKEDLKIEKRKITEEITNNVCELTRNGMLQSIRESSIIDDDEEKDDNRGCDVSEKEKIERISNINENSEKN